jgi:hypothetical protein
VPVSRSAKLCVAVSLGVVVLAALIAGSAVAVKQHLARSKELAEVKTVDDLLAQRPVVLPKNVKVWLGISSKKAHVNDSVVLYALVEGMAEESYCTDSWALGPLHVRDEQKRAELMERLLSPDPKDPLRTFFMRSVELESLGPHEIVVTTRDGAVVARTWISVAGVEPTFRSLKGARSWSWRPAVDGTRPRRVPNGTLPDPFARPSLRLEVRERKLVVSSWKPDLWASGHYFARWWVNDRPVVSRLEEESDALEHVVSFESVTREETLPLEVDRRRLGALPSDRISLQLAYDGGTALRLTNRVELP